MFHAQDRLDRPDPVDPEPRRLVIVFCVLARFGIGLFLGPGQAVVLTRISVGRLLLVAVVSFIVDDDDALPPHKRTHDALDHLAVGFFETLGEFVLVLAPPQDLLRSSSNLDLRALLEGMVVRDDDARFAQVIHHVARDDRQPLID